METVSQTIHEVFSEVRKKYSENHGPTIIIVALAYSKFADFDLLVCYGDNSTVLKCDGYQMKLGRSYPKRNVPSYMQRGFLFRGGRAPAGADYRKDKWQYSGFSRIFFFTTDSK